MSEDRDIRATLRHELEAISGASTVPDETLRRARRRRRYTIATAISGGLASVVVVLAALQAVEAPRRTADVAPASTPSASESPEDQDRVSPQPGDTDGPPPVTIAFDDQRRQLSAWSYCYGDRCVNGAPPGNPPDVGSPEDVVVSFPDADWSFTAVFTPAGEECGRQQHARPERTPRGDYLLRPVGRAGTYDVTLLGDGDGSLAATFRWSTRTDGPLPEPEGRAAIVTDQDGSPRSYGVEVELINLAETPEQASATVTVEARDGESITFEAMRASGRCLPEGSVVWDGPAAKGRETAKLGDAPFRYTVEVMLDGRRYVGTGTWPQDEIRGNEPSISLEFSPPLPEPTQ